MRKPTRTVLLINKTNDISFGQGPITFIYWYKHFGEGTITTLRNTIRHHCCFSSSLRCEHYHCPQQYRTSTIAAVWHHWLDQPTVLDTRCPAQPRQLGPSPSSGLPFTLCASSIYSETGSGKGLWQTEWSGWSLWVAWRYCWSLLLQVWICDLLMHYSLWYDGRLMWMDWLRAVGQLVIMYSK